MERHAVGLTRWNIYARAMKRTEVTPSKASQLARIAKSPASAELFQNLVPYFITYLEMYKLDCYQREAEHEVSRRIRRQMAFAELGRPMSTC